MYNKWNVLSATDHNFSIYNETNLYYCDTFNMPTDASYRFSALLM